MAEGVAKAPPSTAVKALDEQGRIGGYLVVWGGAAQPDLQGEYFTPARAGAGLIAPSVLYHHGLDDTFGRRDRAIEALNRTRRGVVGRSLFAQSLGARVLDLVGRDGWDGAAAACRIWWRSSRTGIPALAIVEGSLTPTLPSRA